VNRREKLLEKWTASEQRRTNLQEVGFRIVHQLEKHPTIPRFPLNKVLSFQKSGNSANRVQDSEFAAFGDIGRQIVIILEISNMKGWARGRICRSASERRSAEVEHSAQESGHASEDIHPPKDRSSDNSRMDTLFYSFPFMVLGKQHHLSTSIPRPATVADKGKEIGRASCRERV
jgi:hypothetical protein